MARAAQAVTRVRASRKTPRTLTLNLPITPRLLAVMDARVVRDAAQAALDKAEAPLLAEWRNMSNEEQEEKGFPSTRETRKLRAAYSAADKRLQDLCKPLRAPESGIGKPLPPERILEATLAGWFDLNSRGCVVEALTHLAEAAIHRSNER